jgi:hypothetical protein
VDVILMPPTARSTVTGSGSSAPLLSAARAGHLLLKALSNETALAALSPERFPLLSHHEPRAVNDSTTVRHSTTRLSFLAPEDVRLATAPLVGWAQPQLSLNGSEGGGSGNIAALLPPLAAVTLLVLCVWALVNRGCRRGASTVSAV